MTAPLHPEGAHTYRAPSGLVVLIPSAVLGLFLLGDTAIRGSWGQMLLIAPWVLLALWILYEISYVSFVRVDDEGVVVQNMLRRTRFGWARLRDVDLRWQLEFTLDDGRRLTCWGGPARSRPPRARRGEDTAPTVPSGLRTLTDIRDRWETAAGDDASIRREWDRPALVALAIIAVWAVAAIFVADA